MSDMRPLIEQTGTLTLRKRTIFVAELRPHLQYSEPAPEIRPLV